MQALNIVVQGVLAGEVEENETGIFAYYEGKREGEEEMMLFRFAAWRCHDGQLRVFTLEVGLPDGCDIKDVVCFSN